MITEKENYLRCYKGEMPEWIPRFTVASPGRPPACVPVRPSFLNKDRTPDGGGTDIWGLEYIGTESMGGAALPAPGKYIISDISKWRDVLHAPELSRIDWEAMAAKDMEKIDRGQTAVKIALHSGYFQALVNMMGYENGLLAFYEDPDEVKAMLRYLSDFYTAFEAKVLEYYKPDIYGCNDDVATAIQPFISPDFYREFIKPMHKREYDLAKAAGCFLDMHCCGKCEIFIDDWMDMGVQSWNPAQVSNDLPAIKKKYGDRLVLIGCWDSQGPAGWLHTGEELTRAAVRECINSFADNGKFIFWASTYGSKDNQQYVDKTRWIAEEYESYGRNYYKLLKNA